MSLLYKIVDGIILGFGIALGWMLASRLWVVLVLLSFAAPVFAQTMRTYLVPRIGDGKASSTAYRPKYVDAFKVKWAGRPYGDEPWYLVTVALSDAQHASLIANPDVVQVVASRASGEDVSKYAALRLPVQTNEPLLMTIQNLIAAAQRLKGLGVGTTGKNLNTPLTAEERARLQKAGIFVPAGATYQEVLRVLGPDLAKEAR